MKAFILLIFFVSSFAWAKTIVLLDTGIKVDSKYKKQVSKQVDFTKSSPEDTEGHGTHLFGLLIDFGKSKDVKVINIKIAQEDPTFLDYLLGLRSAVDLKPDVINISFVHKGPEVVDSSLLEIEKILLQKAEKQGTKIVAAAGNNSENLDTNPRYPCAYTYKNIYCVGSKNDKGKVSEFSNYGTAVKYWENGENVVSFDLNNSLTISSGTSQSAAKFSNKLK